MSGSSGPRLKVESDYPALLGAGTLYMARELARVEQDDERKARMKRVATKKAKLLNEAFPAIFGSSSPSNEELKRVVSRPKWSEPDARTYLVELVFADPFAPWDVNYEQDDFRIALKNLATEVGLERDVVDEIHEIQREATKAHHRVNFGKIAVFGLGGAVVIAAGGWMLAPALGAALGGAAGLSGAAATNFGLALLGGGSLAAGGAGVAGGMAVVTGVAATTGLVGASGAQVMMQLGARGSESELIKLQTHYKAALLHSQMQHAKAKNVAKDLAAQEREFERNLEEERKLNEKNSRRLKDLEATLKSIKTARTWMAEQAA